MTGDEFDDDDRPRRPVRPRRTCTCAGVAPGYPQHEPHCGQPETEDEND